jgi:hypothetical protein
MTRQDAMELLQALPEGKASLTRCADANPALLGVWSRILGRQGGADVWTEFDVTGSAALMIIRHIQQSFVGEPS